MLNISFKLRMVLGLNIPEMGLSWWQLVAKNPLANAGDLSASLIPGLEEVLLRWHSSPLQDFWNPNGQRSLGGYSP